ncbi:MAG TPA: NHL repeat-containing protein [Candidatus Dormibacteraeota bacterium]|nr:NHL repeat-containing protein [Candidatus Dormibacteraeota bacterium]
MTAIGSIAAAALVTGCSFGAASVPTTLARTSAPGIAPTAGITASVVPTATTAPLPALPLAWEKSGPAQPTPCCQTWWPAIDPKTGNIWVANSFGNEFWIFAPDGSFKGAWGTAGAGNGQFDFSAHRSRPQATGAIAFAPDGTFFVADDGNQRVQEFDAKRAFVRAWGSFGSGDGQFANPFGIVTDGKTVYVADDDRGDIQAFDTKGRFLRTVGTVIVNAGIFLAIDSSGTLYRAAGEDRPTSILKYAADGSVAATIDTAVPGGFVTGLAIGPNGTLFANIGHALAAGHQLVQLDATGRKVGLWSTGGETGVVDAGGTAIYLASNGDTSWPTASLRKYSLPN